MTTLAVVLLKLVMIALPLAALAGGLRIYPRARLIGVALVPCLAAWALFAGEWLFWLVITVDALVITVAMLDLLTLPRKSKLTVERHAGRIASLRKSHSVSLVVINHARRGCFVSIHDSVPQELAPQPATFTLQLGPQSRSTLHYALNPEHRGAFAIDRLQIAAASRLSLWQRLLEYPVATVVNVYPDMRQLSQYALLARTNRLSLLGVRRMRRIGQDHDFERLRDYTVDDNYRHIDWRATARRRKLTVKDFQTSQSQRIIFLVDCGRMMTNEAGGLSLFDHALNAMLMLSYVALRQGDSVGMVAFSDEIHSFVPARGGMNQMNRLLHASFDRFPQLTEAHYDEAFRYLAAHCRRRSLVVLVTNVIDEVNSNQIERYLTNLVGRHLPLCILLRDRQLFDAVAGEEREEKERSRVGVPSAVAVPEDSGDTASIPTPHISDDQLWQAAAAADILGWRHQVLVDLQRKGVLVLDVFPEAMTAPLVNRYLEIKARHLL